MYLATWNEAKVAVKLLLSLEVTRLSPTEAADLVLSHTPFMLEDLQAVRTPPHALLWGDVLTRVVGKTKEECEPAINPALVVACLFRRVDGEGAATTTKVKHELSAP